MGDVYSTISEAGPEVIDPLIQILELRAADTGQRAKRESYEGEFFGHIAYASLIATKPT